MVAVIFRPLIRNRFMATGRSSSILGSSVSHVALGKVVAECRQTCLTRDLSAKRGTGTRTDDKIDVCLDSEQSNIPLLKNGPRS